MKLIRRLKRIRLADAIVGSVLRLPSWLLGLAAILLFTTAVGLAVAGGVGSVGASIGRSLLTALIVGLIGWLWFGYYTSEESTGELRRKAQAAPESLFPSSPRVGSADNVIGRDELVADLMMALNPRVRTGPQVLVGDSGSGKTSVLLRLAASLAQDEDVLPIVLSLQGKEDIDFYVLARERFEEYIDPHVRATADVDRLWRWLSKRGKIVILADDLDLAVLPSAEEDPNRRSVRAALEASNRRGLPLVVTSRPYGVPSELAEPPIALGPVESEPSDVARRIIESIGFDDETASNVQQTVEDTIKHGKLVDNVFYIDVVRDLTRSRGLPRHINNNKHAVRIALLNRWYESLIGHSLGQEEDRRRRVLADVCEFAAATLSTVAEPGVTTEAQRKAARSLQSLERVRDVVFLDDRGQYRFVHEVLHAYLASRFIVDNPPAALHALEKAADLPRLHLALVLAAAETHDARFCRNVCEHLLRPEGMEDAELRLLRAAAAAEVALAGNYAALDNRIGEACAAARIGASSIAKRAAIDQLADLSGEAAVETLWAYVGDSDYRVRWGALQKLVDRCVETGLDSRPGRLTGGAAYRVLAARIAGDLSRGQALLDEGRQPDDWEPEILPLKLAGWILPVLGTALSEGDPEAASLAVEQLDHLLELEFAGITQQRGLEASIAQGFKVDARLFRDRPIDERLLRQLERKNIFWYSQLNLLHAITLRSTASDGDSVKPILQRFVDGENRHPFVRATARMCLRGIKEAANYGPMEAHRHIDEYVWDDEGVVVSHAPRNLASDAVQLVGEIMILLNLNEGGTQEQRLMFGDAQELPYCFHESRERREFFVACVGGDRCRFLLCPIAPPLDRLSARRDISRAFCRHQRFHASARTARLWGSNVQKRALRDFWLRIESTARF